MARLYKTPEILRKSIRKSYYVSNKYKKLNKAINVDSVETRLLKVLNTMIEEKQDWTLAQVMRRANVSGASRYRYADTYKDTIEMIKKYQINIMQKDADERNIPNFDTLEHEVLKKTSETMIGGTQDIFDSLIYEMKDFVSDDLYRKACSVSDAFTGFTVKGMRTHPAFAKTKNIKERFELISEKYSYVQKLREEYERLKSGL